MANLKQDLHNVNVANLHQYGVLQFEEEAFMTLLSDENKQFKKFQFLCFNQFLVAIELEKGETFLGIGLTGISKVERHVNKKFFKHFRLKEVHQITLPELDKGNKNYEFEIRTFVKANLSKEKSLIIRFPKKDKKRAENVRNKFEDLRQKAHSKVHLNIYSTCVYFLLKHHIYYTDNLL